MKLVEAEEMVRRGRRRESGGHRASSNAECSGKEDPAEVDRAVHGPSGWQRLTRKILSSLLLRVFLQQFLYSPAIPIPKDYRLPFGSDTST